MAPLVHGNPVVVVAPTDRRVDQYLDIGMRLAGGSQRSCRRPLGVISPTQVATQLGVVLDQEDRGPGIGCSQRCSHARRPSACDQDVRVDVTLVVGTMGTGLPVNLAAGGEFPEDLLVERPQKLGAHERLVVEARGQETAHQLVGRCQVEAQARPHVLA